MHSYLLETLAHERGTNLRQQAEHDRLVARVQRHGLRQWIATLLGHLFLRR